MYCTCRYKLKSVFLEQTQLLEKNYLFVTLFLNKLNKQVPIHRHWYLNSGLSAYEADTSTDN